MGHKFLFIGGLHRSGTSPLFKLLREHADISGFRDTGVPEDEGQHLQTLVAPARSYGGPGRFAFDERSRLDQNSHLVSADSRAHLMAEWSPWWDLECKVLMEKSPPTLLRTPFFQSLFPEALFVLVVRHPVAVAGATQKMSGTSPVEMITHWAYAHHIMCAQIASSANVLVLRYEDLARDAAVQIALITRRLGVPPLENPFFGDHNPPYLAAWESEAEETRSFVNASFGAIVARFGYALDPPYVLFDEGLPEYRDVAAAWRSPPIRAAYRRSA